MIELFYGDDLFNLQKALEARIAEHEDSEIEILEKPTHSELMNSIKTESIFQNRRLIVSRDFIESLDVKQKTKFIEILEISYENTDILLIESKPPTDQILKKIEIKKEFSRKDIDLNKFIKESVKNQGGTITPLAVERLASFVGNNLTQLNQEIIKLVLFRNDEEDKTIDVSDVEMLVHANFEANIFRLIDAIAVKNTRQAVSLLNEFMQSGENGIYILAMVAKQFRNIAIAKSVPGISEKELSQKAGIHPFVAKKSLAQSKRFTMPEISNSFKNLAETDLKLKSGWDPGQALLDFVIKNSPA